MGATAKLTVSVKRRLGSGDEVFIAPGVEIHCAEADLPAKQAEVTAFVNNWMQDLLAAYPDPTVGEAEMEDDADADDADADELDEDAINAMDKKELLALAKEEGIELTVADKKTVKSLREAVIAALAEDGSDEDEADADDADADDADADEDELTEEEVGAMDKDELLELAKDYEVELTAADKKNVKALRLAVIASLFAEDDADADDADADEDDADADADEEGEGEDDDYTEEDLEAMKLADLQEICSEWEIGDPKLSKTAKLPAKKAAYIAHILKAQDEE